MALTLATEGVVTILGQWQIVRILQVIYPCVELDHPSDFPLQPCILDDLQTVSILEREIRIVIKIVFQKHYKVSTQIYSSNLPSKSILLEFFILCKCSLNIICSWIYEHSKIICLYQKFYLWGNPFKTLDHYSWYEFHHKVHWMKFIRLLIQAILLNDVCLYFNMTLAWNKGTEIYLQNEHINLWFFGRDFSMFKMFLSVRITLTYEDIWPAFWYLLLGLYK